MTHILITFLGRTSKGQNGYRKTRYRFPDGATTEETAFIGWCLRERLRPNRLVILGTGGSMWEYLVESLHLESIGENEQLDLLEANENKAVNQALLDRIEPLVRKNLGCEVDLVVIPYGKTETEQIEILQLMADQVPENASVSLDVTHGFRHLPMLALMSALHLRVARHARIAGIYYGAYDPDTDTGAAPIYDLSGLLRIADWVGALHTFDKDGDYGVFADLLAKDLPASSIDSLREAAFFERTSRVGQARSRLKDLEKSLDRQSGLTGASGLFEANLRDRIQWCQGSHLYKRQQTLARHHLDCGDFLRATLFGFEAFVTSLVQRDNAGNPENFNARDKAKDTYEESNKYKRPPKPEYESYRLLRDLRNQIAHGNTSHRAEVQQAMTSEPALCQTLTRLFDELLVTE